MRCAFVIQVRDIRPGEVFAGRAEHVRSGVAAHFGSSEELLDFVDRMVREEKAQEEEEAQEK